MRIFTMLFCLGVLFQVGLAQDERPARLTVPTLSPFSEINQQVALTRVKLTYARPSAKGRKIYGGLVPFGEVWRTGANASTKLTFSEDVSIEGNALKAGTYALYTIPGETEWTMIIHKNIKLRSLAGDVYKPENDAFRFTAKPEKLSEFVETFTIGFTDLKTKSCRVSLSWENTKVSFRIDFAVDQQIDEQIAKLSKAPGGLSHQNLFRAAEYYFHNDRDLDKAIGWIKASIVKSPKNFRYGLLHAKILSKQGKRSEALKVIATANAWAKERNNANYIGQTQLFWDSIKR
ncbi:MAG: DUF2911 domain-containing protein [Pyrinomonadaceae bacterium]|nr:DUF2911 domain-containing protein [Pyrinomonadaceae bacterium]